MDQQNISALLQEILSELQLLTSKTKANALIKFQKDYLITEQQRKIYQAFDGDKDFQAVASLTGASLRSVQLLAKGLIENDLVDYEKRGRFTILRKSTAKIATYYARQEIENTEEDFNE